MSRRAAAFAIAAASVLAPALLPGPAAGQGTAVLEGTFAMSGTVTVAHNVRGEYAGEQVSRSWTFTQPCPSAPCATIQLVRSRPTGTDTLVLTEQPDGSYAGAGSFYLPLRCARRIYLHGERVGFTITAAVTGTIAVGGVPLAQAISATYTNRARRNLTPCVTVLGHDAATYSGLLQPPAD